MLSFSKHCSHLPSFERTQHTGGESSTISPTDRSRMATRCVPLASVRAVATPLRFKNASLARIRASLRVIWCAVELQSSVAEKAMISRSRIVHRGSVVRGTDTREKEKCRRKRGKPFHGCHLAGLGMRYRRRQPAVMASPAFHLAAWAHGGPVDAQRLHRWPPRPSTLCWFWVDRVCVFRRARTKHGMDFLDNVCLCAGRAIEWI